ncbi:thioredoxin domain-containing protein [candidate division KSB1 bacterium]|nr:thioredoxin domain-containing protein [candidate division KSB1 bacterium]NIR68993.1 thioredoxin domain-containing protein [candidate division KSB1 bacterium]NIS22615.1 thioredoxin domain-containing protein [candidate division KSB1 bacterium]NIT69475.1 thioredoxin domain-containing protein [candidate division KSB1 bacterium]NIU23130.1 thioredoxin domain-containing protein [candidate division KSB1 bacterium]
MPQERAHDDTGRKPLPCADELKDLPPDGGPEYNRLVFEKSPYLLQHAGNPVDWYPWGEEAFEKAKKKDKPIFLSIGYSTCHWCHVMEHESFEDPEVAKLMNDAFVSIKVDREERPDIDQIYMSVCQAMTGSGGWPLTIIMTPDKRPFFAGTYFPKTSRMGRVGMMDLVPRIKQLWENERDKLLENAQQVVDFLQQHSSTQPGEQLTETILNTTYHQLSGRFDETHGGFGSAPKFPSPHNFTFLLRYGQRTGDEQALQMVEKTLHEMRLGGIFDHVGFGFHRYSTDPQWLLPHFEKMLYDQAMLAMAYIETYQATGKEEYARTAREIFTYVLRDMTSPEGGFYSAEDADSEGEEGLFYLWTPEEIKDVLGDKEGEFIIDLFNVEVGGNFVEQATGQKTGRSILHLDKSLAKHAENLDVTEEQLRERWERARKKLFEVREKRVHPLKDDKILTDWNGLMIAAFAKGAAVLDDPKYAAAARKAADFVWDKLRDHHGRLLKRYRQGEAALPAHVEDYAFMVWGLLELYDATFEIDYLKKAIALNELMLDYFWDKKNGGLFFTADSLEDVLVRTKEIYDGAIPSGNSVAALNLVRLGRITANPELEEKASAIGQAFSEQVKRAPMGHTQLMSALTFMFGPSYEVVVAGETNEKDTDAMLTALQQEYFPNKVTLFRPTEKESPAIADIAEFTKTQKSLNGKATAYVCKNYACNAPTTEIDEMLGQLKSGQN